MFLLSLLSLCFAGDYEYWGHWRDNPTVVLCDTTDIAMEDVKAAVDYWNSKGYDIKNIITWDYCSQKRTNGVIKITPPGEYINVDQHFGFTTLGTTGQNDDIITSSIIELAKDAHEHKEVIIHELGHALGIKHCPQTNDIMYYKHVSFHTDL
jgi:hypothetical protein